MRFIQRLSFLPVFIVVILLSMHRMFTTTTTAAPTLEPTKLINGSTSRPGRGGAGSVDRSVH